jgi:DNA-binding MarR family transcriptional regulator
MTANGAKSTAASRTHAPEAERPSGIRERYRPDKWLAGEVGRTDPGSEAWSLMHWLMVSSKPRMLALGQEFDLPFQGMIALRILGGGSRPMGELAKILGCDSSNVTAITDRLEERGLVTRQPAARDRRVKILVLTEEGERVRVEITKRLADPPPAIAALSNADQKALRDILRRAIERQPGKEAL